MLPEPVNEVPVGVYKTRWWRKTPVEKMRFYMIFGCHIRALPQFSSHFGFSPSGFGLHAGCVRIRRVAATVPRSNPEIVPRVCQQSGGSPRLHVGAHHGNLGEIDPIQRPLNQKTGFVAGLVQPRQIDLRP